MSFFGTVKKVATSTPVKVVGAGVGIKVGFSLADIIHDGAAATKEGIVNAWNARGDQEDFNSWSVAELKDQAEEWEIKGTSSMNKRALVKALKKAARE
jgi:hypothetical protein